MSAITYLLLFCALCLLFTVCTDKKGKQKRSASAEAVFSGGNTHIQKHKETTHYTQDLNCDLEWISAFSFFFSCSAAEKAAFGRTAANTTNKPQDNMEKAAVGGKASRRVQCRSRRRRCSLAQCCVLVHN